MVGGKASFHARTLCIQCPLICGYLQGRSCPAIYDVVMITSGFSLGSLFVPSRACPSRWRVDSDSFGARKFELVVEQQYSFKERLQSRRQHCFLCVVDLDSHFSKSCTSSSHSLIGLPSYSLLSSCVCHGCASRDSS